MLPGVTTDRTRRSSARIAGMGSIGRHHRPSRRCAGAPPHRSSSPDPRCRSAIGAARSPKKTPSPPNRTSRFGHRHEGQKVCSKVWEVRWAKTRSSLCQGQGRAARERARQGRAQRGATPQGLYRMVCQRDFRQGRGGRGPRHPAEPEASPVRQSVRQDRGAGPWPAGRHRGAVADRPQGSDGRRTRAGGPG